MSVLNHNPNTAPDFLDQSGVKSVTKQSKRHHSTFPHYSLKSSSTMGALDKLVIGFKAITLLVLLLGIGVQGLEIKRAVQLVGKVQVFLTPVTGGGTIPGGDEPNSKLGIGSFIMTRVLSSMFLNFPRLSSKMCLTTPLPTGMQF